MSNGFRSPGAVPSLLRIALGLLVLHGRARRRGVIRHHDPNFAAGIEGGFVPDLEPQAVDRRIAARLLRAYALSRREERQRSIVPPADIWSGLARLQGRFEQLLERADEVALARYLCNMCRHDATIGTIQGNLEHWKLRLNPLYRAYLRRMFKDKLLCLAEAVGALPCENPEQGAWGESMQMRPEDVVTAIESVMGMEIAPPPVDGGLYKVRTTRGHFHERDLNALFTAWMLARMQVRSHQKSICEIGGGTGRVAYWSMRLGVGSYAIVDLPRTNVVQGFYLMKSLGEDAVRLFGETPDGCVNGRVDLMPHFCKDDLGVDVFDIVLNQDSFPEVNRASVLDYLAWIRRAARGCFVSINHESKPPGAGGEPQNSVAELVAAVGGYERVSRNPYWLRQGYVAEVYEIVGKRLGNLGAQS